MKRAQKKIQAYFTVEAALLFPFVLGVLLFVIYSWFYQYDRCLMEQDMGALALRGCTMGIQNKEELMKQMKIQETQLYMDKYIAWQQGKVRMKLEKDTFRVEREGYLAFPFYSLDFGSTKNIWKTKAVYENHRISPVLFVRNCRKVIGGK